MKSVIEQYLEGKNYRVVIAWRPWMHLTFLPLT
jgi:hypothetical protein